MFIKFLQREGLVFLRCRLLLADDFLVYFFNHGLRYSLDLLLNHWVKSRLHGLLRLVEVHLVDAQGLIFQLVGLFVAVFVDMLARLSLVQLALGLTLQELPVVGEVGQATLVKSMPFLRGVNAEGVE